MPGNYLSLAEKIDRFAPSNSNFAGIDVDGYPGNTFMEDLWNNTNVFFTGFYLGATETLDGPCCFGSSTWMPESSPGSVRSYLADVGFGFMPLYLGMQEGDKKCPSCNTLTTAQGTDDANRASNLMAAAGFANGAVCWLDVELGGTLSAAFIDYISAWVSELNNHTDYWAGVYCSYDETAAQIATACGADNVNFWVWDLNIDSCQEDTPFPTPSPSSAYSNATALQYAQNCTISNGVTTNGADLDSSVYSDPSINPIQG